MIQANELRHNSYYLLNGKLHKYDATSVVQWQLSCYEPIFITGEILDKCGFKGRGYYENGNCELTYAYTNQSNELDEFQFHYDGTEKKVSLYDSSGSKFPIEIKYVHQLQNLYFSLTGKEIIIKL